MRVTFYWIFEFDPSRSLGLDTIGQLAYRDTILYYYFCILTLASHRAFRQLTGYLAYRDTPSVICHSNPCLQPYQHKVDGTVKFTFNNNLNLLDRYKLSYLKIQNQFQLVMVRCWQKLKINKLTINFNLNLLVQIMLFRNLEPIPVGHDTILAEFNLNLQVQLSNFKHLKLISIS